MAMKLSLIQLQDRCLARMSEPRTSERRRAKNYGAALRGYRKAVEKCGYPADQVAMQIKDIKDMYWLNANAEE